MSFFGPFNRTINSSLVSSLGIITAPDTATLMAEVDMNGTMATVQAGGNPWQVSWILGAGATIVTFVCEQCLSTGLGSTAMRDIFAAPVSSNQSAQFITKHNVEPGDRFRVRVVSSVSQGASAKIIAEPMA